MGTIGIEALAAHQITLQSTMLALMIVMGISQSGSILISHNMNKDPKFDRTLICKLTLLIGVISMQIMGISYWLFSDALISVYVDTQNPSFHQIAYLAKNLLILAAVTQIFDAARNISSGLLRGYGDTKTSMWTGLVSCWIIGIPMAVILAFIFHLNAVGLRLGMMLGILYGCIQLINRLVKMNKTDYSTQTIATGSI
jgi:MATE family multidrug resistance protein